MFVDQPILSSLTLISDAGQPMEPADFAARLAQPDKSEIAAKARVVFIILVPISL